MILTIISIHTNEILRVTDAVRGLVASDIVSLSSLLSSIEESELWRTESVRDGVTARVGARGGHVPFGVPSVTSVEVRN